MKNIFKLTLALCASAMVFASCIKETFPMDDSATADQVNSSATALEALTNAIPAAMVQGYLVYGEQEWEFDMSYPGMMIIMDSALGDIVDSGDTGYDWFSYWSSNNYSLGVTTSRAYVPWRTFYLLIKGTNDVISIVDPETATDAQKVLLGQALSYRAFLYHALASLYEYIPATDPGVVASYKPDGEILGLTVPIVSDTTSLATSKANPRVTKEAIYKFIMDDLDLAEECLANYAPKGGLLPTLPVVYGLKAKMYMELSDWGNAASYARKGIDAFGGSPLTQAQWEDPVNGFNNYAANSNSWMWYLSYSAETMGNLCNFVAHMSTEETWTSYGWAVGRGVPKSLYDQIPDTDFRKHSWIDPEGMDYYAYKMNRNVFDEEEKKVVGPYANLKFRPAGGDYATYKVGGCSQVPLMRVEELMLIEAEALAMNGDIAGGKAALTNLIKTRNPQYSCENIATATGVQNEVYKQKRIEFWGEGICLFDAKRLAAGVRNGYKDTNAQVGYRFNCEGVAPWWTWMIPQVEINGNPVLDGFNNPDPTKTVTEWTE